MKKIKVLSISMLAALVVAISLFALTGCGGNEPLEGTWEITSLKIDDTETISDYTADDTKFCIVFTSDSMHTELIDKEGNVDKNPTIVKITQNGNTFSGTDESTGGKYNGTVNGNKMTITGEEYGSTVKMEATKQK